MLMPLRLVVAWFPSQSCSLLLHVAFAASCNELQTTYLDLYLVHWPGVQGKKTSVSNREARLGTWRALQELYAAGKCKAIGMSCVS